MFKKTKRIFFALILVVFLVSTVGQKYADNIDSVLNLVFGEKNPSQEASREQDTTTVLDGFEGSYKQDSEEHKSEQQSHEQQNSVELTFIDVGQGDCTLIQDAGQSMLIDTGYWDAYDTIDEVLKEKNISKVDVLVLTHPDADHIGAAADLMMHYEIGMICTSIAKSDSKTYQYVQDAIELMGVPINYPMPGETLKFGSASYKWLGPVAESDDTNSMSLVLKLQNGNDSFLFTGDMTGKEMEYISEDMSANVLKAAHHGSANDGCNSSELFDKVNPEFVIISCKKGNQYGHPHKETMQEIQNRGIEAFRTDLQGTISCKSSGNGLTWNNEPTDNYQSGNEVNEPTVKIQKKAAL